MQRNGNGQIHAQAALIRESSPDYLLDTRLSWSHVWERDPELGWIREPVGPLVNSDAVDKKIPALAIINTPSPLLPSSPKSSHCRGSILAQNKIYFKQNWQAVAAHITDGKRRMWGGFQMWDVEIYVSVRKHCSLWAVYSTISASHVTVVKVKFVSGGTTVYKPVLYVSFVRCQNFCGAPEIFPFLVECQQF